MNKFDDNKKMVISFAKKGIIFLDLESLPEINIIKSNLDIYIILY